MTRPAQITIDLSALQHNLRQIRQITNGCRVIAMVKSNAYGHGIERVAAALPDADALGVACLEEGLCLRKAGVKNPIILMEGLFDQAELPIAIANNFTLVVHHAEQIAMLEKSTVRSSINIWLKINTGMYRLGFAPAEVKSAWQRLMQCQNINKPIGLMTHFAEADVIDSLATEQQISLFNMTTADLPGPRSLANSAGILAYPIAHTDWVRPGIMLYGASPFAGKHGADYGLQPVMSLTSQLIAIHDVVRGAKIGYGGTWTAAEDMRVGVIAMGYGDGYPRHAPNGTPILVNNKICPLVGRVSMDMLAVDLTLQPNAVLHDPVTLWGAGLPVEMIAESSQTTCYELLTRMMQRVRIVEKKLTLSSEKKTHAII